MIDALPPLLADIAEVAGTKAALDLVAAFGGQRIYVPRRPTAESQLARAVGLEAAKKIAARFAPDRLDIPNLAARKAMIETQRLVEQGASLNEIARKTGVIRGTALRRRKKILQAQPLPLLELMHDDREAPRATRRSRRR